MRGGRVDTGWEGRPTAKTSKVRLSIRDRGAALTLVRRGLLLLLLLPDSDAGYADLPLTLLNAPVNIGETGYGLGSRTVCVSNLFVSP